MIQSREDLRWPATPDQAPKPDFSSLSSLQQISADKKTLGRFCGQLDSPLGNPPGNKEFLSQGNKMLLTFHTDFSNEENGTIMFYKGFLAYYQAVGECSPQPALPLASATGVGRGQV